MNYFIYKTNTMFMDANGRERSGTRWVVKDENGEQLMLPVIENGREYDTDGFKTRKQAVQALQNSVDGTPTILYGRP